MTFEGHALPAGCDPAMPKDALYTVAEIYPEHVVLDGNHPLAGIALRLSLQVASVREATEEEIGAGTAGTGFFRVQVQAPDDGSAPPPLHEGRSTQPMDSWATSSMDLLDGVQIVEHTDSPLPDDLHAPTDPSRPSGAPH